MRRNSSGGFDHGLDRTYRRNQAARFTEAATLFDVPKAKDFVSWASSSGTAKGRVKSVHKGKVPALPTKVVGTETQPAARVEMFAEQDGGWVPTGVYVGLSAEHLTAIDDLPEPSTTEAVVAGSYDAIRRQVQAAIEDSLEAALATAGADAEVYVYVQDLGPDWAVYCSGYGDDTFKVTYSIDSAGAVTLGDPVEVLATTTYEPIQAPIDGPSGETITEGTSRRETDRVTGHLIEAKGTDGAGGRIFGVRIIANGDSKNGRRYPQSVLDEAAPLYEGAKAYDHHRSEAELRTSTIQGLVGSYRDVEAKTDGLYADLHLLPSATHTAESLDASLAAQDSGLAGLVGISHDVMASYRTVLDGGRRLQEAVQILSVNSADVVADPAAGGRATRMVAGGIDTSEKENDVLTAEELAELLKSMTPEQRTAAGIALAPPAATAEPEPTTEATVPGVPKIERDGIIGTLTIERAVKKIGLPDSFTEAVTAQLPSSFTEAELSAHMGTLHSFVAGLEKQNLVPTIASAEVTKESTDKKIERLNATFDGDFTKGYPSFKEAWRDIAGTGRERLGDEDVNRRILAESCGGGADFDSRNRSTESVSSGTWNLILGDSITRRMVAEYQQPALSSWRSVVSSMPPVNDFRSQKIERMGGYGTLPGVNQGAPYQPLTTAGNEEASYAITKRGGTEDLTLETIANDDLRAVTRIPVKLGLAAAQTLFRFVWDMLRTNATCSYDSTALFAAGHGNTDAAHLLSQTNLSAGRLKMRQQTAFGDTSDVLSIVPKYIVVPSALEELAFQLSTSAVAIPATPAGPTDTPNIHQGLTSIVLDYLTTADTWFLVADPAMTPTLEVGFYQGRQDPDLLVQSDATVGSVFSADKITYKIRHIYSGAVLDHRGFYRGTA